MQGIIDRKTEKVAEIIARIYPCLIQDLLVVGCGDGLEAAVLADRLEAKVIGIDVADKFDETAAVMADLRIGDAMSLDFADERFDFVFSYHALEHFSEPVTALREMHRILRPGGGFWIGTPNRTRLIGYIGAKEGSVTDRIRWNIDDYRARFSGRFRNECGAHAGFSSTELGDMLREIFSEVQNESKTYFDTLYASLGPVPKIVGLRPFSRVLYPSVYFSGRK